MAEPIGRVPQGTCGLKFIACLIAAVSVGRRVPQGTCGLKFIACLIAAVSVGSGPARDLWIEIGDASAATIAKQVGSRKGPVD